MPDGLVLALLTATPRPVGPSPSPSKPSFDPNAVTPGTEGFVVTFALVIVVVFLLRDFSRRVRRINLRGQEAERRAAEQAAAAAGGTATGRPPGGATPGRATPDGRAPGGAAPGGTTPGRSGTGGAPGARPAGTGRRRPPSLKKPSGEAPTAPS